MRYRNIEKIKKKTYRKEEMVSLQLAIVINKTKVRIFSFLIEKEGKLFYKTFLYFRKTMVFETFFVFSSFFFPSGKKKMWMNVRVENWWNDLGLWDPSSRVKAPTKPSDF